MAYVEGNCNYCAWSMNKWTVVFDRVSQKSKVQYVMAYSLKKLTNNTKNLPITLIGEGKLVVFL